MGPGRKPEDRFSHSEAHRHCSGPQVSDSISQNILLQILDIVTHLQEQQNVFFVIIF